MIPRVDEAIALERGERPNLRLGVRALAVGDFGVAPVGVVLPSVERAHDLTAVDGATVPEVGAEMRTERLHDVGYGVGVAPPDEMAAPVVERARLLGELVGIPDAEPSEGDRKRESVSQA